MFGRDVHTPSSMKRKRRRKGESPARAVAILNSLGELEPGSYERQLYLSAALDAQDWQGIVNITDPPVTIGELVQRFDAYCRLRDPGGAIDALDRFSRDMRLPGPLESELRARASAQEAMGR